LNLPFADDGEFVKLHAAIRLILPLIPAIAAASPFLDGLATGLLDNRLDMYRRNCEKIFSVTGHVIPEPVENISQYHERILGRIYDDLAPHDPEGVLRFEWANARGAIARFDRRTIEIRVVDIQECPLADLAVLQAITTVVRLFTDADRHLRNRINALASDRLFQSLLKTMRDGENAVIDDAEYLACLGISGSLDASAIWRTLIARAEGVSGPEGDALELILNHGTLATRLCNMTEVVNPENLRATYQALCACLEKGQMLMP